MKFAVASIFALANGIVAMPWSSGSFKPSSSNTISAEEDITLHIKVSQNTPKQDNKVFATAVDVCLKVCWPETPTCPTGWYSNNMGTEYQPCWTCCKAPEDL